MSATGPHQGQRVLSAGEPVETAQAALIMVHGRGATADSILSLTPYLPQKGCAFLAPQAAGNTWYPNSFLAPMPSNEPGLSSALAAISDLLITVTEASIPTEKVMLLGFSQGACLALEFAARNARRYGGVVGLSGGLIGPDGTPRNYPGSMEGTPVFLGCSEPDFHIPTARVHESADVFQRLGAQVTKRLYPNMGHTIHDDEIEFVNRMMAALTV